MGPPEQDLQIRAAIRSPRRTGSAGAILWIRMTVCSPAAETDSVVGLRLRQRDLQRGERIPAPAYIECRWWWKESERRGGRFVSRLLAIRARWAMTSSGRPLRHVRPAREKGRTRHRPPTHSTICSPSNRSTTDTPSNAPQDPPMKPPSLLALAALALALAISLSARHTAAQDVSPNEHSGSGWVKGPQCSSSAWGGVGCCCRRPTTVRVTKYKTKTAVKTVKRTRTLTRTVTTTTLVRRRLEARQDDEEPEEAVDPAEEILETPTEEPLPPAPADEEPAVAPLGLDEAPVEQSPVDAEERRLFARNYCQACPRGVAPRPSGSGERCCVTKVTSTTTRTKTTTRIKTTTVKTATKTITVTASQSAAVRIPVQVKTQNGTPVGNALVQLVGPPIGRLGKRDIWAFCYTHPTTGICNLLYPTPLTPNSNYAILTPGAPDIPIPTDASGQPPPPPSGGVYPIVVPESSARLGARELIARKGADGRYRRALKARATPAPVVF